MAKTQDTAETNDFDTFIDKVFSKQNEPEPFCPFQPMYCDLAYTSKCRECKDAELFFAGYQYGKR